MATASTRRRTEMPHAGRRLRRSGRRRGGRHAPARDRGFTKLEIYSPAPFDRDRRRGGSEALASVRIFTLVGGLLGVVTGYAMTIWMSLDWPIMIGGKPFASIPPYTVIAFEADHPLRRLSSR